MSRVNFNNRKFIPFENSDHGTVTDKTVFEYAQEGDLVTANYSGETVISGKIIAKQLKNGDLEMLYHCLTDENELKAGKAYARVSVLENDRVRMDLNWQWLTGDGASGKSVYLEVK